MTDPKITHLKAGAALIHLIDDIIEKGGLHCDTKLVDDCVDAFAAHALETVQQQARPVRHLDIPDTRR